VKRFSIGFALIAVMSSPALAGNAYVEVMAGAAKARPNDIDETVAYVTTPSTPAGPVGSKYDDVFGVSYKTGADFGVAAGYDFGWFRLEGELAQKRVKLKKIAEDDITTEFLTDVNSTLNRPGASPALTIEDFEPSGTLKVGSAIVNTMFDFKVVDRFTVFVGGGMGRSFARGLGDKDGAWAGQYMLGGKFGLTDHLELGAKYRYFNSGVLKLDQDPDLFAGNPGPVQTTTAAIAPDIEGEFRTRSLLASLTYNF